MLDFAVKGMKTGAVCWPRRSRRAGLPEGRYGDPLGEIAAAHPDVTIGSYPSYEDGRFDNQIVVRGKDEERRRGGAAAVEAMLASFGETPRPR